MSASDEQRVIPVVLFAYARPAHLARVLGSLRENRVPLIEAFADGAKGGTDSDRVAEVRAMLRGIDWCEMRMTERSENLGLGRNVIAGVSAVAAREQAFIVWEDDLVAVPGTYAWVSAALRHYADDPRVMSVSAWTHPCVTPAGLNGQPYFDGRAECWVWGAWGRSWVGMETEDAIQKMAAVVEPSSYGDDLPQMAAVESKKNIWAVRWLYHHLQHGALCLRPPWSMVEHIGFDAAATNAAGATAWANPPLQPAPVIPTNWPAPHENPQCRRLWQRSNRAGWRALARRMRNKILGR